MRKLFELNLNELYKNMNLSISLLAFKNEVNTFLRENDEEFKNVSDARYIWATIEFEKYVLDKNIEIDEIMENIKKFIKSTIIILRLPNKEYNTLIKAKIKYLDDLKECMKNPSKLMTVTGLSLDIVEKILNSYSEYILSNK